LSCERGCLNLVMLHIYSGYEKSPFFLLFLKMTKDKKERQEGEKNNTRDDK